MPSQPISTQLTDVRASRRRINFYKERRSFHDRSRDIRKVFGPLEQGHIRWFIAMIMPDEELIRHARANLSLLNPEYAKEYPGCELFCAKASDAILERLRQLNDLPRTDPFWKNTNNRPTVNKLDAYCRLLIKIDPKDSSALWTMAALAVSRGDDGFGYDQWKALHALGHFDVTWPICAALLQGGPAGISAETLARLVMDMGIAKEATPHLQRHAVSEVGNVGHWANRVLTMLKP